MGASELCDYIEKRHHTYIRLTASELADHLETCLKLEKTDHPELKEILIRFKELRSELEQHFNREERILFPLIRELQEAKEKKMPSTITSSMLEKSLDKMNDDHKQIYQLLQLLRTLSKDYLAPENSAPTLKKSYQELHDLEEDLMKQFYLEENILNNKLISQ